MYMYLLTNMHRYVMVCLHLHPNKKMKLKVISTIIRLYTEEDLNFQVGIELEDGLDNC